jgi:hypothetical protein
MQNSSAKRLKEPDTDSLTERAAHKPSTRYHSVVSYDRSIASSKAYSPQNVI